MQHIQMMSSTRTSLTISRLLACLAMTAASCAHNAASSSGEAPPPEAPRPQLVSKSPAPAAQENPDASSGRADLDIALKELSNVDLFFGFNEAGLTAQAKSKLSNVADVLVKHPGLKLEIEGNCDERGTEAYNLVLGQQRADVARTYLINLGVKDNQIATVSFGAERPKDPGHNDKAWQENRRDDVVVNPSSK